MRTFKRKLCEAAVVLGCLVGVIVIGASDDRQRMTVDRGMNVEQEEYVLSESNQGKSADELYEEYVQKVTMEINNK